MKKQHWLQRLGSGLVIATTYVLLTAAAARIILLSDYEAMLHGFEVLGNAFGSGISGVLVNGGIFATLVHLIRKGIPEKITEAASAYARSRRAAPPPQQTDFYPDDPPPPPQA